jgi:hypothetical protein
LSFPVRTQGNILRKKQGTGKPLWELTKRDKCLREQNKQEMERCSDCVCVQQDFLLQVLKWNLCEKTLKRKQCCSA